jgi:hypothetical protein
MLAGPQTGATRVGGARPRAVADSEQNLRYGGLNHCLTTYHSFDVTLLVQRIIYSLI